MTSDGLAQVVLDRPAGEPAFLIALTHGAGGTPDTGDVLAVRDVAAARGAVTALVTQPYRVRGGRAPGSAVRQDAAWTEVIAALVAAAGRADLPLVQGGRSNGARVMVRTAKSVGAAGVIALAFPLRPPASPDKSREAELRAAGTRVLVVNGERDPFGIPEPDAATTVVVLPGETHALSRNPAATGDAVAAWLAVIGLLAVWVAARFRRLVRGNRWAGAVRWSRRSAVARRCHRTSRPRCRAMTSPALGGSQSCAQPLGRMPMSPDNMACAGTYQCLLAFLSSPRSRVIWPRGYAQQRSASSPRPNGLDHLTQLCPAVPLSASDLPAR